MSGPLDWQKAFARQAAADFRTWQVLQANTSVPWCHKLLFLQMACEKLCKAHLIATGTPSSAVQTSHGYVANPLPIIVRQEIMTRHKDVRKFRGVLIAARHLAQEIELLNPAVDRNGQRPDNCEYPWESGGNVHSPLDWSFSPSHLLTAKFASTFLKLVQLAIERMIRT